MRSASVRLAAVAAVSAALLCGAAVVQAGQSAKVDVTGKWAANVETSAGSGAPNFTFKQDGEKLTGHYVGTFGEADLTGTVKGPDIKFTFSVDVQGTKLDETYTGTVDKDSMKGKVEIVGIGEGTFTAKRQ
jgi:hypothetical protein